MKKNTTYTKIQELTYELQVHQAMTRNILTLDPENTIHEVIDILRDGRISGAPVLSGGKMIGLISIEDVVNCLLKNDLDRKVREKMTTNVESIFSDEPLVHAIQMFEKLGFGRLPVLDRSTEELVGMLTKGDIIMCLLKKLEVDYHKEEIHRYRASHIFEDIPADRVVLTFQYEVESGAFHDAGKVSSRLRKNLLRLGIHPDIVRRITICAYEAEMNIVIYTEGGSLAAEVQEERIRIRAHDRGPGIPDVEQAMTPGFSTAPDWVRELGFGAGMGLPNIKRHSDRMNINTRVGEYTHLEFEVNVS